MRLRWVARIIKDGGRLSWSDQLIRSNTYTNTHTHKYTSKEAPHATRSVQQNNTTKTRPSIAIWRSRPLKWIYWDAMVVGEISFWPSGKGSLLLWHSWLQARPDADPISAQFTIDRMTLYFVGVCCVCIQSQSIANLLNKHNLQANTTAHDDSLHTNIIVPFGRAPRIY